MSDRMKYIAGFFFLLLLIGCTDKSKHKLLGVWQLQLMEIDGTKLQGGSIGDWKWEFNDENGYMALIAGISEKGRYQSTDSTLTLQHPVTKRPEQVFKIVQLDSVQMVLVQPEQHAALHFIRVPASSPGREAD